MIMLPFDPHQERLDRMREELSQLLHGGSGSWVVVLKDRDIFFVLDGDTNQACIATPLARLSGVSVQRIDQLIEQHQPGNDDGYLRIAEWLWAQSLCPASSLEVDGLIERISRVSRLADAVLEASMYGQPLKSQTRQVRSRPSRQNNTN